MPTHISNHFVEQQQQQRNNAAFVPFHHISDIRSHHITTITHATRNHKAKNSAKRNKIVQRKKQPKQEDNNKKKNRCKMPGKESISHKNVTIYIENKRRRHFQHQFSTCSRQKTRYII